MKKKRRVVSMLVIVLLMAAMLPAFAVDQEEPVAAFEQEEVLEEYTEVGDLDAFELGDIFPGDEADGQEMTVDAAEEPVQQTKESEDEAPADPQEAPTAAPDVPGDSREAGEEDTEQENDLQAFESMPGAETEESIPVTEETAEGDEAETVDGDALTTIQLQYDNLTLGVGESANIGTAAEYTGEEAPVLTYTTSDKKIAKVTADGTVKGVAKGKAIITVTTGDGAEASCSVTVLKAPGSISLNTKKAVLGYDASKGLGMTFQLVPKLPKGTMSAITFLGYNASVVHVDENGLVTAVGIGRTNVYAKTFNGKKAKIEVVVKAAPGSIKFNTSSLCLAVGDVVPASASIPTDTVSPIEFFSDNTACATINAENGELKAITPGEATIIARTFNGQCAECKVSVYEKADRVEISSTERTLGVGEKFTLAAYPMSGDTALDSPLTFTTGNKAIAVVDSTGKVTAKKKGKTTIYAIASSGATAECAVTVVKAPSKLSLGASKLTLGYDDVLGLGESADMGIRLPAGSASHISFSGYDPAVVRIDADGIVTAVGPGSTKITVKTFNGKKTGCHVTVKTAPQSVAFDRPSLLLCEGQRFTDMARVPAGTASAIEYTEDDPQVASINTGGVIEAVQAGETDIWARAFNGALDVCHVTVVPAPETLEVSHTRLTIGLGEKNIVIQSTLDGLRPDGGIRYRSANTRIAKVSADGVVTPVRNGRTTITVTSYNGKLTRKIPVTVYQKPKKVSFASKQVILEIGDHRTMKAVMPKGQGGTLVYASSDSGVAGISADGTVTALAVGTTDITVETYNGLKAACRVNVVTPAAEIAIPESIAIPEKLNTDFAIEVFDAAGEPYAGTVGVSVSPTSIAEWKNGMLKGKKKGKAVITVKAGSLEKKCSVTVAAYATLYPAQSIAHRGGAGYYPENTLEAFEHSAEFGATGIELDVHTTLDGVQVVHHDNSFVANGQTYVIANTKWSVLKAAKPSICTLDEALDVIEPQGLDLHLELKDSADGAKCVEIVNRHGMADRTVYFSFYDPQLRQVYAANPAATIGKSLKKPPASAETKRMMEDLHIAFYVASRKTTTQSNVDAWHKLGLKVCIWTVNNRTEAKKFAKMGVDYILSDFPDYVP